MSLEPVRSRVKRTARSARRAWKGTQAGDSLEGNVPLRSGNRAVALDQIRAMTSWQVISPGRSGTRWFADLLLAVSPCGVVHASRPTLAEIGFLLDQGSIGPSVAEGAYLQSRMEWRSRCALAERAFVDLDCKNSPLAPMLLDRYPGMRFLVMLREPKDFILSGVNRGYFRTKIPRDWGHLCDSQVSDGLSCDPEMPVAEQAIRVALFWNRIASIAHAAVERAPERTLVISVRRLFESEEYVGSVLTEANLPFSGPRLETYSEFGRVKNANPPTRLSIDPVVIAEASQVAVSGLAEEFLAKVR